MKKQIAEAVTGFAAGVALNGVICLAFSYTLRLGYYAPCFAGLTEICGGELNGALMQTCAFGLTGSAVGLADCFLRRDKDVKDKRHHAL
ncbi:MAG: hypothetical protein Q4B32_00955 [Clostridia bacterium]|nr:hypothetical protein [Clostridia bacterium]